jgi:hypothetical protein
LTDLSQTVLAKSEQLTADDLQSQTLTVKITNVSGVAGEQPIKIEYEGGDGKPYYPCKSMRRVLIEAWGSNGKAYVGRSMTLYRDPAVKFGGLEVGGIRISHMSDIKGPLVMALTSSKSNKKPFTVQPLKTATPPPADPETESLKVVGLAAAEKGMADFTTWGQALTPEQKEKVKAHLGAWTKIAKEKTPPASDMPGM